MPIHDWTRVSAGDYHNFHQDWTIEMKRVLNRGILPTGFEAAAESKAMGWEPDVVTVQGTGATPGGPPASPSVTWVEPSSS